MINVTIAGRLGKDAEIRQTNGNSVCSFSVAADVGFGDNKQSHWFNCSMWGKRGEAIAPYLTKGTQVTVIGEFSEREYQGKQYKELRVDNVKIQGGGSQAQQNNGGYQQQSQPQPSPYAQAALNTAQKVVQNTPVGQAISQQFTNGQSVPPAYQNNPQFAPQNPNQQQPNFNNNMQGEPKPSTVDDDIPFIYISNQLTGII